MVDEDPLWMCEEQESAHQAAGKDDAALKTK
jgi:hypothetical protein